MSLAVVPFPPTVLDVPSKLRELADELEAAIEAGAEDVNVVCVVVNEDVEVRGFGRVEGFAALGVLSLGQASLQRGILDVLAGGDA